MLLEWLGTRSVLVGYRWDTGGVLVGSGFSTGSELGMRIET